MFLCIDTVRRVRVSLQRCFVLTEVMFTKSVPDKLKLTVKGGAAVDPDSGKNSQRSERLTRVTFYYRSM